MAELPASLPGGSVVTGNRVAEGAHEGQSPGGHQPAGDVLSLSSLPLVARLILPDFSSFFDFSSSPSFLSFLISFLVVLIHFLPIPKAPRFSVIIPPVTKWNGRGRAAHGLWWNDSPCVHVSIQVLSRQFLLSHSTFCNQTYYFIVLQDCIAPLGSSSKVNSGCFYLGKPCLRAEPLKFTLMSFCGLFHCLWDLYCAHCARWHLQHTARVSVFHFLWRSRHC